MVTVLLGPVALKKKIAGVRYKNFTFFDELKDLLRSELKKKYDIVIHAAAVSDYRPEKESKNKIRSGKKKLRLTLVPTRKLIDPIKRFAPDVFLVGFKLESTLNRRSAVSATKDLFEGARCDLVVANRSAGQRYEGYILNGKGNILAGAKTKEELARKLVKTLKESV